MNIYIYLNNSALISFVTSFCRFFRRMFIYFDDHQTVKTNAGFWTDMWFSCTWTRLGWETVNRPSQPSMWRDSHIFTALWCSHSFGANTDIYFSLQQMNTYMMAPNAHFGTWVFSFWVVLVTQLKMPVLCLSAVSSQKHTGFYPINKCTEQRGGSWSSRRWWTMTEGVVNVCLLYMQVHPRVDRTLWMWTRGTGPCSGGPCGLWRIIHLFLLVGAQERKSGTNANKTNSRVLGFRTIKKSAENADKKENWLSSKQDNNPSQKLASLMCTFYK